MKDKQATFYRVIAQSFQQQKLSHAHLLTGAANLLESAYWLAGVIMTQSLDETLIDEMVTDLKEVPKVDFQLIDGSTSSIKKEEIAQLQQALQNTALEKNNQKVVIIHHIHQATIPALNAILKTLEEPSGNTTTFILTSPKAEWVLPTILSRCVVHQLDAIKEDYDLSDQHPMVVKHIHSLHLDESEARQLLQSKSYQAGSSMAIDFLNDFQNNPELACVQWQLADLSQREAVKVAIELLYIQTQALLYNREESNPYTLKQIKGMIQVFTKMKSNLNPSTNLSLLVDEACCELLEVFNDN